jgi:hypothetical protein
MVGVTLAAPCQAHFLWIKSVDVDGKPQGLVFFNEGPADEAYHFPEKLAKVKLWSRAAKGQPTEVATKGIETDDRVGLIGPLGDEKTVALEASQQYGVYGTSLLVYHAKHVCGTTPEAINKAGTSKDLRLEIVPTLEGGNVELDVLWEGQPLADAKITIMEGERDPVERKADGKGHLSFKPEVGGIIGILANTIEKEKSGELGGKKYDGVMHYASLTLNVRAKEDAPQKAAAASAAKSEALTRTKASILTPLPEPLSSFGAVVSVGWLYVYSGHTGGEHEHSAANLSKHFRRIKLDGGAAWEELPMQTPLQGLPIVAHGGKIYRVGGLSMRNATTDDEEDIHSVAEFAQYDPETSRWTALAPLPSARSSHNAAVIGDKLYVVGGWRLEGKSPGTWDPAVLAFDFTKPQSGWQKLPHLEFKRRALAAGVWKGKLVALGGMDETNKISMRVDFFDPQSGRWEKGPKLPGAGMAGFGASAWNLDGNLYVCGLGGVLYRLNDAGSEWEEAGLLATPRFFHQLVPGPDGGLMVVGGASPDGHLATIERVVIRDKRTVTN